MIVCSRRDSKLVAEAREVSVPRRPQMNRASGVRRDLSARAQTGFGGGVDLDAGGGQGAQGLLPLLVVGAVSLSR